MNLFPYYKNDMHNSKVAKMQFYMYSYITSQIYNYLKKLFLYNPYVHLYFDSLTLYDLKHLDQCDHRLIQTPHDYLAAIFRYKVDCGEYQKEFFEKKDDEVVFFFKQVFIDVDFLEKIDKDIWFLTLRWYEFVLKELHENIILSKEIFNALFLFRLDNYNSDNAFASSAKTGEIIKRAYNNIPWNI
jgi:hypothetical protein